MGRSSRNMVQKFSIPSDLAQCQEDRETLVRTHHHVFENLRRFETGNSRKVTREKTTAQGEMNWFIEHIERSEI